MSGPERSNDCPFCARRDRHEYERCADEGVMRFEPLNPVTPGHMLFMPKAHHENASSYPQVTGAVFAEAAHWARQQRVWVQEWDFERAYNLITSSGRDATQSVTHLHVHYVPRFRGDGLTLPWTDQAPVAASSSSSRTEQETQR